MWVYLGVHCTEEVVEGYQSPLNLITWCIYHPSPNKAPLSGGVELVCDLTCYRDALGELFCPRTLVVCFGEFLVGFLDGYVELVLVVEHSVVCCRSEPDGILFAIVGWTELFNIHFAY